jgi:hypothetical protein
MYRIDSGVLRGVSNNKFVFLAVIVCVLVGLLYGFFIAIICGPKISNRHYHILAKQELTKVHLFVPFFFNWVFGLHCHRFLLLDEVQYVMHWIAATRTNFDLCAVGVYKWTIVVMYILHLFAAGVCGSKPK